MSQDETITVELTTQVTANIVQWSVMLGTEPTKDAVARSITTYYRTNIMTADVYVPGNSQTIGRVV